VRVLEINPFDIIEFSQNIENSPIVEKNSLEQIKILFTELIETLKNGKTKKPLFSERFSMIISYEI